MKIFKTIKKGFTLVELVIVIAVIAVLSAVLIPVFGNVVKDSRVSALKASLKTCTSNLIMYSLYNQVDYYTPSVIREFLKSEGIKGLTSEDSEFCEDGYSIWYNQENFNVILVKNEEIVNYVNAGSSTASVRNGNVAAMAADIFGNVADGAVTGGVETSGASDKLGMLPRRPEAITANENLLLVATDEANKDILKGIEYIYHAADPSYRQGDAYATVSFAVNQMKHCELFNYFGRDWNVDNYAEKFDKDKTAWLNSSGNFCTDAPVTDGRIKVYNVVVSPDLGKTYDLDDTSNGESSSGSSESSESSSGSSDLESLIIDGEIRHFGGAKREGVSIETFCALEIASTLNIELSELFYGQFRGETPQILISGNVSLPKGVAISNAGNTTTISTVTGGASNISSVVNAGGGSAVTGGSITRVPNTVMSPEVFLNWTTSTDPNGPKVIDYDVVSEINGKTSVSITLPDGTYKSAETDDLNKFFENNIVEDKNGKYSVLYKYNTTSFNVNVNEFLKKAIGQDVDDLNSKIIELNISYNAAVNSSLYTNTVFLRYYGKDGYMKSSTFNFGIGYISSFDHYYRYPSGGYIPGETDYISLNTQTQSKNSGSLQIKLPEGAFTNLQSYANGNTVEVYYDKVTRFYKNNTSELVGVDFKTFVKEITVESNCKAEKSFGKTDKGNFTFEFNEFARADSTGIVADYYINMVKINRIVIKDKDGKILIVKYPEDPEVVKNHEA